MMKDYDQRLREIFLTALDLSGEARAQHLGDACGGDPDLLAKVETLLAAHEDSTGILNTGADLETRVDLSRMIERPGSSVGPYRLLEKIGEGGFGTVYMAEQKSPVRRRVALKIIKLGMDTRQVVGRFEAERQALAMMDHPFIAKVFDGGATSTGRPYFAMELIRGTPITTFCDGNRLGTRERLELFVQVCHAVHHAHQKGVIHRDIKPSNILIAVHDERPVPKIIDFGIAKATQFDLTDKTVFTQFRQFLGTPAYMSPEQAEPSHLDIDTRSDIYSLGVLLYEMLTGRPPLSADELVKAGVDEMRRCIQHNEPLKPSTRVSQMSPVERSALAEQRRVEVAKLNQMFVGDLDWVVMKALEKDRTRRYDSSSAFAIDIQNFLADRPVSAGAPTSWYRVRKLVRRHRVAIAVAASVFLALVIGLISTLHQAQRAGRAESRALEREFHTSDLLSRSLYEQATAKRLIGRHGHRTESFELLKQSIEWSVRERPAGFLPHSRVPTLQEFRTEAVASFVLADSTADQSAVMPRTQFSEDYWQDHILSSDSRYLIEVDVEHASRSLPNSSSRRVRLFDLWQNEEVGEWDLAELRGGIVSALASGGDRMAVCNETAIELFNPKTMEVERTLRLPAGSRVPVDWASKGKRYHCAFSPSGRYLVFSWSEKSFFLWDLAGDRECEIYPLTNWVPPHSNYGESTGIRFSPDGDSLIYTFRSQVQLFDIGSETVIATQSFPGKLLHPAIISPTNEVVLIMEGDGNGDRIEVWDLKLETRRIQFSASVTGPNVTPCISRDGSMVAVDDYGLISIHQLLDGAKVMECDDSRGADRFWLAWDQRDQGLHAGGYGAYRRWDLLSPSSMMQSIKSDFKLSDVALSPDGGKLALAENVPGSGRVRIIETETERTIAEWVTPSKRSNHLRLDFSSDGRFLIAHCFSWVSQWRLGKPEGGPIIRAARGQMIVDAVNHPERGLLYLTSLRAGSGPLDSGVSSRKLSLYLAEDQSEIWSAVIERVGPTSLELSPSGKYLFVLPSRDARAFLLDLESLKGGGPPVSRQLSLDPPVSNGRFISDEELVCYSRWRQEIGETNSVWSLWATSTGSKIAEKVNNTLAPKYGVFDTGGAVEYGLQIDLTTSQISLVDLVSNRALLSFPEHRYSLNRFSAGSEAQVAVLSNQMVVHLWDLRRMRAELGVIGVGW